SAVLINWPKRSRSCHTLPPIDESAMPMPESARMLIVESMLKPRVKNAYSVWLSVRTSRIPLATPMSWTATWTVTNLLRMFARRSQGEVRSAECGVRSAEREEGLRIEDCGLGIAALEEESRISDCEFWLADSEGKIIALTKGRWGRYFFNRFRIQAGSRRQSTTACTTTVPSITLLNTAKGKSF